MASGFVKRQHRDVIAPGIGGEQHFAVPAARIGLQRRPFVKVLPPYACDARINILRKTRIHAPLHSGCRWQKVFSLRDRNKCRKNTRANRPAKRFYGFSDRRSRFHAPHSRHGASPRKGLWDAPRYSPENRPISPVRPPASATTASKSSVSPFGCRPGSVRGTTPEEICKVDTRPERQSPDWPNRDGSREKPPIGRLAFRLGSRTLQFSWTVAEDVRIFRIVAERKPQPRGLDNKQRHNFGNQIILQHGTFTFIESELEIENERTAHYYFSVRKCQRH